MTSAPVGLYFSDCDRQMTHWFTAVPAGNLLSSNNHYIRNDHPQILIFPMFSFRFLFLLFILIPFIGDLPPDRDRLGHRCAVDDLSGCAYRRHWCMAGAPARAWPRLTRVRLSLDQGGLPAMELIEGAFSSWLPEALLLTPGFFTDCMGFVFLTPPLRRALVRHLLNRGVIRATAGGVGRWSATQPEAENPSKANSATWMID
jgi:hypothetical protein